MTAAYTWDQVSVAVLSVTEKDAVVPLARALVASGCAPRASRGTRSFLAGCGIDVDPFTDAASDRHPEMGGHLDVFDPDLLALILGPSIVRPLDGPRGQLALVACDLRVGRPMLEVTDVGGSFLLRAAARSWESTIVLAGPSAYGRAAEKMLAKHPVTRAERHRLAVEALAYVSEIERRLIDEVVYEDRDAAPVVAATPKEWSEAP